MRTAAFIGLLIWAAGAGAVGEPGGAYGGGTTPQTGQVQFEAIDRDGDGKLTAEEARAGGIERFEEGDANGDGVLDEAEFAALEREQSAEPPAPAPGGGRPQ